MTVEPMTEDGMADVRHCLARSIPPLVSEAERLIARIEADAATISTLTAERDAAVARAMPEPRLVRTVEEVGALTTGAYRIAAPWQPRRWILGWRHPTGTWTLLIGAVASGVKDDHIVGSWVQRLPDLPTPTAAQEAANG